MTYKGALDSDEVQAIEELLKIGIDPVAIEAEQPSDVSASRADNTWETNDSDHPIVVYVESATGGAAAASASVSAHVNTAQTNNVVAQDQAQACDSANSVAVSASVTFVVPPGHDYKVDVTAGIDRWFEHKIGKA